MRVIGNIWRFVKIMFVSIQPCTYAVTIYLFVRLTVRDSVHCVADNLYRCICNVFLQTGAAAQPSTQTNLASVQTPAVIVPSQVPVQQTIHPSQVIHNNTFCSHK